jgi:heptosyltransferase-2
MKNHKILIIKTGYSESLEDRNNSRKVSLGDVLRTTPLLHLYKENQVTWVTDLEAFPLLEKNPLIHQILPYDFTTALQLQAEEFDTVINLEKIPGICALSDKVKARRNRYGFTFNSQTGGAEAFDNAYEVLAVSSNLNAKKENKRTSQELLFEMVGAKWNEEKYILGYKPKTSEIYDIALNTQIGLKWPTKAWPKKYWDNLEEKLINQGLKVTRQDKQNEAVLKNLNSYMDWINSSRLIMSNDSLGLHLGIALNKKVIGLFGPTTSSEVYFYNRGKAILPKPMPPCMPCFKEICENQQNCMDQITVDEVYKEINMWL